MKLKKQILLNLPESYLVVLVILSGYTPPLSINSISIALAIVIIVQIIFKNTVMGLIIACLFALVNVYMLFAVLSEFGEYSTFNDKAQQMLIVGSLIFVLNTFACVMMILKYSGKFPGTGGNNLPSVIR
jgi:hypothetical protein